MDALEFLRERERLCESYKGCVGCPAGVAECVIRYTTSDASFKRIIAVVEQWSKDHPRKTRQSVFLEQYPKAMRDREDILSVCPQYLDSSIKCLGGCNDCRREFWMQEKSDNG